MKYDLILSLTTWKKRIYDISFKKVIFSMLKQKTMANYHIVLVLSTDEFTNKEKDIPKWILELNTLNIFEILWTKENTRAYKKYFPTRRAYPAENIVALDDDSYLHENFVETFFNLLKNNKDKMIIGTDHFNNNKSKTIKCVRFGAACFRPNSLYNLDEKIGRKYFHEHDDEFFALLSVLAGAHSVRIDIHNILDVDKFQQNVKLSRITRMDYGNLRKLWNDFFRDYPKLKNLYYKNELIKN